LSKSPLYQTGKYTNLLMISMTWNNLMNAELKFMHPTENAPANPAIAAVPAAPTTTLWLAGELTILVISLSGACFTKLAIFFFSSIVSGSSLGSGGILGLGEGLGLGLGEGLGLGDGDGGGAV
jgi:hypothetical protein